MAASPKPKVAFSIDDALTVDENIAAFALKLKIADADLAARMTPSLTDFSNEVSVNQDTLLDTLYAATAPTPKVGGAEVAGNKVPAQ